MPLPDRATASSQGTRSLLAIPRTSPAVTSARAKARSPRCSRRSASPPLDELVGETVPGGIRLAEPLDLPAPLSEPHALAELREKAAENQVFRSFIGMGYHDCVTPAVILRNVLENPGWYTQYTPYQAEIAQGRLEALLNFQTMVKDLTGLPLANASLLDEATAAAEAMTLCVAVAGRGGRDAFFVAEDCHPQTIAVVRTKAEPRGIRVHVGPVEEALASGESLFGALVQYPATDGAIRDYSAACTGASTTPARCWSSQRISSPSRSSGRRASSVRT